MALNPGYTNLLLPAYKWVTKGPRRSQWFWTAWRFHVLASFPLLPGLNRAATIWQHFHFHHHHCSHNPHIQPTEENFQVPQSDLQGHLYHKRGEALRPAREKPHQSSKLGPWAWTHCWPLRLSMALAGWRWAKLLWSHLFLCLIFLTYFKFILSCSVVCHFISGLKSFSTRLSINTLKKEIEYMAALSAYLDWAWHASAPI